MTSLSLWVNQQHRHYYQAEANEASAKRDSEKIIWYMLTIMPFVVILIYVLDIDLVVYKPKWNQPSS